MARQTDREGPIQAAIVSYLRTQFPHACMFSVPNELASKVGAGRKDRQKAIMLAQARAKKQGMLPGAPDLVMIHQGEFYAFEVKAEGNYQQQNQKAAQASIEANGGRYFVVRSVDDVAEIMADHKQQSYADLHAKIIPQNGGEMR